MLEGDVEWRWRANSMLEADVEWRWRARSELEGRWSGGQEKMDTIGVYMVFQEGCHHKTCR